MVTLTSLISPHPDECMSLRDGGGCQRRGSGDSRPPMAGDPSRGTGGEGTLGLNLICRVIHNIDSFLPGSSLPARSESYTLCKSDLSQGTREPLPWLGELGPTGGVVGNP